MGPNRDNWRSLVNVAINLLVLQKKKRGISLLAPDLIVHQAGHCYGEFVVGLLLISLFVSQLVVI